MKKRAAANQKEAAPFFMRPSRSLSVRRMMYCPSFRISGKRNKEYFACEPQEPFLSDCADCPIRGERPGIQIFAFTKPEEPKDVEENDYDD